VRANGVAKYFPGAVKPVVQWCLDNDINMIQMPCPEFLCAAGGPGREPHGKTWYERRGLRETSRDIAISQASYAKRLADAGCRILAIIGMEFSPACAVNYLNRGRRIHRDEGIYFEELRDQLIAVGLKIPFVGVNQRALKKLARDLDNLLLEVSQSPANLFQLPPSSA
jgi:predicted secreted protein